MRVLGKYATWSFKLLYCMNKSVLNLKIGEDAKINYEVNIEFHFQIIPSKY